MEENENINVYLIPANYTDSGKIFGGMLSLRNAIEAILLVALLGYLEYALMAVTLIPLAILAMIGINGDSLFTFLAHMTGFLFRRRQLTYREGVHEQKKN